MLALILVSGGMLACDDDTPSNPIHEHEVASVTVQPSALTLSQGGAQLVTATARCGCGSSLQESFAWTSGNPDVALVDPDGTIHGVGFGTTTVTATAEGIGAVISVVVLPDGVIVGPAGGTVTFPDGSLQLEIPAGALATETDVVVERVADATFAGDPFYAPGTAFRLRPDGLLLQTRARLRIHYDPALLPDGVEPERLRLRIRDQDGWGETWQHQHQHQIQRVEGEISRFGVFALVAVPEGQWVGPAGAVVTSADGLAEVDIPAGALAEWADVTLAPADAAEFAGDPLYVPGTAYRLQPDGLQLQERARLRIHYDPDGIPLGLTPDRLRLRERDRTHQQWAATPENEVHGEQHRVQARIQRFGVFAVVAEPLGTVVGVEGGLVVAGDGAIEVVIPPGALEEAVDIIATPVDDAFFAGEAGFVPGTGWELGPSGLQFQHEATVRIRFDPTHLPAGVTPERLRLRVRDHDQHTFRETVRSRLRLQEHKVEGEVSHFSVFGLMATTQGAGGVVSVAVNPAVVEVEPGSTASPVTRPAS